ncbi:Fis family transcriptional regulator [Sphingomonas sp. Leaf339]|uniref:sigma-54-dependent transcriptional regulator n=1 Tax=Sphingomonas sp. Leaf339 TaxID=1736343 RepID=UPI0006FEF79E|nr:sigma-54 dependent transcriptional regulator [Sphingomonas sp. Leaf339]KQU55683.1 Fis family transcriptional regulator [Sphingomonas sp. Leaf339]
MNTADVPVVALVDDDDDLRTAIAQLLDLSGYRVMEFAGARVALAAIDAAFGGVVLTDVRMPQMGGIEFFHELRRRDAELPVILMTGHGDVPMAVDALKSGAWDFLTKPFDPEAMLAAVGRAIAHRSLVFDNRRLRTLVESGNASPLVGRSPAIDQARGMIEPLANADVDILLEGETGTGKELLARLIHRAGKRARHPFLSISCAAFPDALLDDDLFAENGRIAAAAGGTLFLDDVDQASSAFHARLTRLVEERTLGGRDMTPIDLRLIATAGEKAIERMPPALFYRLSAVRLRLPPLRERLEDVPLLFAHLLDISASRLRRPVPDLTYPVQQRLASHDWPGNVRELANFADRVVIGVDAAIADEGHVDTLPARVDTFERQAIIDAIVNAKGEVGQAIQRLGLPRKTFYYKVQRLDIDVAALRRELAVARSRQAL